MINTKTDNTMTARLDPEAIRADDYTDEQLLLAYRESAPYACHTHIAWNIVEGPLVEKLLNLWTAGYPGSYSVEHHTGRDEYTEVAIQLAKVRAVLESFRTGGTGGSLAPRRRG